MAAIRNAEASIPERQKGLKMIILFSAARKQNDGLILAFSRILPTTTFLKDEPQPANATRFRREEHRPPIIILRPPKPIPLQKKYDSVELWCSGDTHAFPCVLHASLDILLKLPGSLRELLVPVGPEIRWDKFGRRTLFLSGGRSII